MINRIGANGYDVRKGGKSLMHCTLRTINTPGHGPYRILTERAPVKKKLPSSTSDHIRQIDLLDRLKNEKRRTQKGGGRFHEGFTDP
jgi:hypothetical protein